MAPVHNSAAKPSLNARRDKNGLMTLLLIAAALIGHTVLVVTIVNRIHGMGISRRVIDGVTMACGVWLIAVPLAGLVCFATGNNVSPFIGESPTLLSRYAELCVGLLVLTSISRIVLKLHPERRGVVLSQNVTRVDLRQRHGDAVIADGVPRRLSKLPMNEVLAAEVTEKEIAVPRLPEGLNGLRIGHLSDLHMSGRIDRLYFSDLVDEVNACSPDIVALTGDLVEYDAQINWLGDTLGRLAAPHGVFFVLGNHDKKIDHARIRQTLTALGCQDVAAGAISLDINGVAVELIGNEAPWFTPPVEPTGTADFVLCLAHGPDQFGWASQRGVGLMLAGHNHGGQIRLPLLGPIVAPSLSGVRYASGAFRRGETVMHVSRGTGSLAPLRFNCPPEATVLTLR